MTLAEIGRRVKRRREALGIKAEELAERIGRTRGYISRLENGKSGQDVADLMAVARELGMKISEMVGETDEAFIADVRRRLPDGTEMAITFERIARGLPNQAENDQEFIRVSLEALAARYGQESETTDKT